MKTINKITVVFLAFAVAGVLAATPARAQFINQSYLNVDWQFNVPISNDFVSKASGWGMNFEAGSYLDYSSFGLGGFVSFHTNNESIPTQTISLDRTSSVTLAQEHSVFQLPFGLSGRYRLTDGKGVLDPYLSLKLGANFARVSSFYSAYESYYNSWGFYLSPEIGTNIFPASTHYAGIHLSAYYSFATNSSDLIVYSVKNLNNFGVRVGITF